MTTDYFAVYAPGKPPRHRCNVLARDKAHALKIARDQGFLLPRGSYAVWIGIEGYERALRRVVE